MSRRRCAVCGQYASVNHGRTCTAVNQSAPPTPTGDYVKQVGPVSSTDPSVPNYGSLYSVFQSHSTAPMEVTETVDMVTMDATGIEFLDHSPGGEEWTNLSAMTDPLQAGNNCFAVTHAVVEHIVTQVGQPEGWDVGTVELFFEGTRGNEADGGVHWATTFTSVTGEEWVMDYTARQFDPSAPFPLVARRDAWQAWVASRIGDEFGLVLTEATAH